MTLRDKLKRGPVTVHVPPADPMMAVVNEANTFGDQVKELVDQCNLSRQRSEWAMSQLATAHQVINNLTNERDGYRSRYLSMVRANGELTATINGLISLGHNARNTLLKVEHLSANVPQEEISQKGNGEEAIDLDAPLADQHQNPTPEEIEEIRNTLAKLPPTA